MRLRCGGSVHHCRFVNPELLHWFAATACSTPSVYRTNLEVLGLVGPIATGIRINSNRHLTLSIVGRAFSRGADSHTDRKDASHRERDLQHLGHGSLGSPGPSLSVGPSGGSILAVS